MSAAAPLRVRRVDSLAAIASNDRNRLFPGRAEDWGYFRACELAEKLTVVWRVGSRVLMQELQLIIFHGVNEGEAEAAVRACGYLRVDNARPSFLLGQRVEARTGERVGIVAAKMVAPLLIGPLMIYHPIPAASVARALVNLSFRDEPGVFIQQYSELVAAA